GRSGIVVSAVGFGCWAIGGVFSWNGRAVGYGQVDDEESIRAIRRALDLGAITNSPFGKGLHAPTSMKVSSSCSSLGRPGTFALLSSWISGARYGRPSVA